MYKFITVYLIGVALIISGCATNQSGSESGSASSPNPYAGLYTGTETFGSRIYPLKITIKENGKVSIVDIDNIWAHGWLEDNKFTVKRYGNAPMVFEGTITGSTITGVGLNNRFLGDGTFTVTLE